MNIDEDLLEDYIQMYPEILPHVTNVVGVAGHFIEYSNDTTRQALVNSLRNLEDWISDNVEVEN